MSNNNSKKIVVIIGGIIFLFFFYKHYVYSHKLKESVSYTIGKTYGFSGRGGTNRFVDYKYFVNDTLYKASVRRNYDMDTVIGKYFSVKFSKTQPNISELYFNQEIKDTLKILQAGFKIKR